MLQRVIYTLIFTLLLSCMMSAWVTFLNIGLHPGFVNKWLMAFANAWGAAFVAVWVLAKPVQQITALIMTKLNTLTR